jgi:hypothetical protein
VRLLAYRAALRLYPRAFRREYGDDMVALLQEQLREENAARVTGRAVLDLLTSVPLSHWEAHVSRSSNTALTVVLVAIGAVLFIVGQPLGLFAALAAFATAILLWRRGRPIAVDATGRWWKVLLGGITLLTTLIVVTTITGELPEGAWFVAMVTLLTSVLMIVSGIVLGITARFRVA